MRRSVAPLLARHFIDRVRRSSRTMLHLGCASRLPAMIVEVGWFYRLALDHPKRVERLAVLDVVPTGAAWDRADARFALAFWPWSLLAQPEPLPERLVSSAPEAVIEAALGGWGSPASTFDRDVREAYVQALRDPAHVHSICEEYRAAATVDRDHDQRDRTAYRRVACPVLVLWSGCGSLEEWYAAEGGPIALWRAWADDVRGSAVDGGHFFPEEASEETAEALRRFFSLPSRVAAEPGPSDAGSTRENR
jgi:haloacetate dehalogenase